MSQMGMNQMGAAGAGPGTDGLGGARTPEDVKLDLASAASRTQRRNTPRAMVLLGVVVLALGGAYALGGLTEFRTQSGLASRAQAQSERVLESVARLRALEEAQRERSARTGETGRVNQSTIERAGQNAGLRNPVVVTRNVKQDRVRPWRQVLFTATILDPSSEAILNFARRAVEDAPGLEVYSITLRPQEQQWSASIQFMTWESVEGGS